jgi:sortase A
MNPDEITPPQYKESQDDESRDAATNVIRSKLVALYAEEPDALQEAAEVADKPKKTLSKHQKYMKQLTDSSKTVVEIQTAWHEYYSQLPDHEKHEVWQEFYSEHAKPKVEAPVKTLADMPIEPEPQPGVITLTPKKLPSDNRSPNTIKTQIITRAQAQAEAAKKSHHVRSLGFGLSMGTLVVLILMFSFFNERFLVPFIRPNSNVSATPIIVDPNTNGPVGPEAKIIIPKINLDAPVVYDVPTVEEKDVQAGLERGVVHYITTPNPGEKGNSVIFGHSSSNILNKGKYKFAFILLKSLDKEDTFIIQKDGKRYVYKVYNKFVVSPTDLSVLGPNDKTATMTLITCDPPGTSTNRLIIQAEQIFPDPKANSETSVKNIGTPHKLAGDSPSLWSRLFGGN